MLTRRAKAYSSSNSVV